MAKYQFDQEEDLGKVVESIKPFCMLSSKRPITNVEEVTTGICGAKFSKLCGFTFTSKDGQHTKFMIVYCPKTKSNFVRNNRGLSGWYCWHWLGPRNIQVMPKEAIAQRFMFNVDKFFNSDQFEKWMPVFKRQTSQALDTVVQDFISKIQPHEMVSQQHVRFIVHCVRDSLEHMADVLKNIIHGAGDDATLAYNANTQYSLDMKNAKKPNYAKYGTDDFYSGDDDE